MKGKKKDKGKPIEEEESCFCMTLQPLMPDLILEWYAEMIFEDMKFNAMFSACSGSMALRNHASKTKEFNNDVCLVIDSGFSFTYATPYV